MIRKAAAFVRDGAKITWTCSGCGLSITGSGGFLTADMQQVNRAEQGWKRFKDAHPQGSTVADLMDTPEKVPWLAWHADCAPDPEGPPYSIDIQRIDTQGKLLHWAGHLMKKTWIGVTDFADLLGRAGDAA